MNQINREFEQTRLLQKEVRNVQRQVYCNWQFVGIFWCLPFLIWTWICLWALDHHPAVFERPLFFMITMGVVAIFVTWLLFIIGKRIFTKKGPELPPI